MTLQSFGFVRSSSLAMGSTVSDEFEILGEQDGKEAPVAKENKTTTTTTTKKQRCYNTA